MRQYDVSQLPVMAGKSVAGVISHRSFVHRTINLKVDDKRTLDDLLVEELMEPPAFVDPALDLNAAAADIDKLGYVLVGTRGNLLGVLTHSDISFYLRELTRPFVLLAEIERAMRWLIEFAARAADKQQIIRNALERTYKDRPEDMPTTIERLTFREHVDVICDSANWGAYFAAVFKSDRKRVRAKLQPIGDVRNRVFHFRSPCEREQLDMLEEQREWLWRRAMHVSTTGGDHAA
jgi:hypothetical protein